MKTYALDMHMMVASLLKSGHHDFRANLKRLVYMSIFNSSGVNYFGRGSNSRSIRRDIVRGHF